MNGTGRTNLSTIIYIIGFTCFYVLFFFQSTSLHYWYSGQILYQILILVGCISFLIKWIFERTISIGEILFSILSIGIGIGILYKTGDKGPILVILAGLSSRRININLFLKYFVILSTVSVCTIIILSQLGYLNNFVYFRDGKTRMSLGDVYPTGLSGKITFILLTWYYIDKFKFSWVKISCSLLIIMFNYQFTDSKVDILTLILLNMVLIFNKLVFYWCSFKYIRVIVGFTPILWTLSLFFGVSKYLMGSSLAYKLDGVFTNRIMYTSQAIQNYSPYTLFGQNIPMTGAGGLNGYANTIFNNIKYFFLDSSYAYVIFCYGILFYLLIILVYYLSIQNQFVVDGSAELAILIFISSLHWFINQYIIEISFSPLIIIAFFYVMLYFPDNQMGRAIEHEKTR